MQNFIIGPIFLVVTKINRILYNHNFIYIIIDLFLPQSELLYRIKFYVLHIQKMSKTPSRANFWLSHWGKVSTNDLKKGSPGFQNVLMISKKSSSELMSCPDNQEEIHPIPCQNSEIYQSSESEASTDILGGFDIYFSRNLLEKRLSKHTKVIIQG